MKKILIAGNWKMNTNPFESSKLAEYIVGGLSGMNLNIKVLVCPPYTSLESVSRITKDTSVYMGAQNCHHEAKGAFTGEISLPMIKYLGSRYIILGHSERRTLFAETDEMVNMKTQAVLDRDLKPIVCIGETIDERQAGETFNVLGRQLKEGLKDIPQEKAENIVIAYEPVWAIGTGLAATTDQVQEAHAYIRQVLKEMFANDADDMLILYGGSMNSENAESLLKLNDVNGGLIGGASLKPEAFLSIIKTAESIVNS